MATKTNNEINAGSMADIAFLLLIFFLVTTTMDQDEGIKAKLPPKNETNESTPRADRNMLEILINEENWLMIEKEPAEISDIEAQVRAFYTNPNNSNEYPSLIRIDIAHCQERMETANSLEEIEKWKRRKEAVEMIGPYNVIPKKAVISIQNHRNTSYKKYIEVYNAIKGSVNDLRNELSEEKFHVKYAELDNRDPQDRRKLEVLQTVFPNRISEAEPFEE